MAVLPIGLGSADDQYQISRSLRFNSADSAYLNWTPGSAGNRKTWTWSGWVKRSGLGTFSGIFTAGTAGGGTNRFVMVFQADNTLRIGEDISGSFTTYRTTSAVYRDISAFYHLVLTLDTSNANAADRIKLYVNGSEVTAFSTSNAPSLNRDTFVNATNGHWIGVDTATASTYINGYLTEVNFIDGQALTPSSFGETDAQTGVWKPKKYTGTYGTNGFYLNFSDNSGTTSTTLGKDSSGNGNNWTPNNFSVTAGAGNDSLVDTPTPYGTGNAGGDVRGNYATLNPLSNNYALTLVNGNLDATFTGGNSSTVAATQGMSTGKWYCEFTINGTSTGGSTTYPIIGITTNKMHGDPDYLGDAADEYSYTCNGNKVNNNVATSVGTTLTTNDILMVAFDADAGRIWWGKNGTWTASGNPTAGTNANFTGIAANTYFFAACGYNSTASTTANFGQRPFAYTAPSGFKALCTTNLPTPTIGATSTTQANKYFDIKLRNGTSAAANITGYTFAPDFVWIKARNIAYSHVLSNTVTGATKFLSTNITSAEQTDVQGLTAFNSDGYSLGTWVEFNETGKTYVDWAWNAGGSNATNTDGTITSTVRANTTAGFSIVTYTGNGSGAAASIGHGLGVVPKLLITKGREAQVTGTDNWVVWHGSFGAGDYVSLNATTAKQTSTSYWGNTAPTSSLFYVGGGASNVHNESGKNYVAYVFAEVAGYSKFGSYTGNGSTDGPFVWLGFRPKYVMVKCSSTTGSWALLDTSRDLYNPTDDWLAANLPNAESTDSVVDFDFLSNGFKLRTTNGGENASGATFIYAAFAESPFKYSLAR